VNDTGWGGTAQTGLLGGTLGVRSVARTGRRVSVGGQGVNASCAWRHVMIRVTRGSELEGGVNTSSDSERGGRRGVNEGQSVNDAVRVWGVEVTRVVTKDRVLQKRVTIVGQHVGSGRY